MSHIFIAHVEEDADIALRIALGLEEAGYRTWCYEVDTVPGPSYILRTGESVAQSQAVVVIISPHSLGSNQVTKEVVRAHESSKPFIPLLRDVTHEEFQQRQPEWREAIGSAASLSIPREGVQSVIPDIIEGIKLLGVKPGAKANAARLDRIHRALNEIHALPATSKIKTPPVKRPGIETEKAKSKKPLIITLTSILVVVIIIEAIFLSKGGCGGNVITANTTVTATVTSTETATVTETVTPTVTATETSTVTPTVTATITSTVTATVTSTVTPPTPVSKPDLIIQDITWSPKNPNMGDSVTFTIAITNLGKAQAASSYIAYYIDGIFINTKSVYSINSGATEKVSFSWIAELGTHIIKAVADFNDALTESDETNNEKEIAFSATVAPDLIIQDITWTPANPLQMEETVFSVTVENQGNGGAGYFYIRLLVDGNYESEGRVDSLLAGESTMVIIRWDRTSIPSKGTHNIKFIVDYNDYVLESDETNNSETIMMTIS